MFKDTVVNRALASLSGGSRNAYSSLEWNLKLKRAQLFSNPQRMDPQLAAGLPYMLFVITKSLFEIINRMLGIFFKFSIYLTFYSKFLTTLL